MLKKNHQRKTGFFFFNLQISSNGVNLQWLNAKRILVTCSPIYSLQGLHIVQVTSLFYHYSYIQQNLHSAKQSQFLLLLFPSLLHPHSLPLILSAPATLTYLLLLQHSACFSLQGFATALPLQIATCSVPPSSLHSSHLLRPSLTTMSGTASPPFGTAYHSFPLNFSP